MVIWWKVLTQDMILIFTDIYYVLIKEKFGEGINFNFHKQCVYPNTHALYTSKAIA